MGIIQKMRRIGWSYLIANAWGYRGILVNTVPIFIVTIATVAFFRWRFGENWVNLNLATFLTVLFGLMGIYYSFATSITLGQIQRTEKKLYDDVVNLEDATRRNLVGFAQIFDRALWLLERAEDQVWYVNFMFGFGLPHLNCPAVYAEYAEMVKVLGLRDKDFSAAVDRFNSILIQKIMHTREFVAITLAPESLRQLFLDRLVKRRGYEVVDIEALAAAERLRYSSVRRAQLLRDEQHLDVLGFKPGQADRLPFQILIASIPGREINETRLGCLVFLVGTENVGGEPRGFYTELDHVVGVYKSVVEELRESCKQVDWSAYYEGDLGGQLAIPRER